MSKCDSSQVAVLSGWFRGGREFDATSFRQRPPLQETDSRDVESRGNQDVIRDMELNWVEVGGVL